MARMVLGLGFALTIMICVGRNPAAGFELEILHLTISTNIETPPALETNNVGVCFTVGTDLSNYNWFQLDILENLDHGIFYLPLTLAKPTDPTTDPMCTFCKIPGCLSDAQLRKLESNDVTWLLHVEESGDDGNSETGYEKHVTTTMPGTLPMIAPPEGIYIIGDTTPQTIKLPSPITDGKLFLNDVEATPTCSGYPCYYSTTPLITTEPSFMTCDDSSEVLVCGNTIEGKLINTLDEDSVTSVTVEYTSGDAKVTVEYTSGDAKAAFNTDGHFTEVINLDTLVGYERIKNIPVTDTFEASLVDDTLDNEKFQPFSVTDRKLEAYELAVDTGVLEVKWAKSGYDYYKMSRTSNPQDGHLHDANVDCSSLDGDFCHAYFVELDAGIHDIQIQKLISWIEDPVAEEDIWKTQGETTKTNNIADEFLVIPTKSVVTTVSESNIEIEVCFNYISNTSKDDTHYEFLAINSKGKWKKEIVYKKKDDSYACFHGLELTFVDFSESSKFFILLRNSNNGKPLASGEVTFDLPAPRAIKPEVDNGNNGSTGTLAIVGAAIAGIACLMALVAAAVMFVMKINRDNDGLQYPLHRYNIEDSSVIHGLDNPIPTM